MNRKIKKYGWIPDLPDQHSIQNVQNKVQIVEGETEAKPIRIYTLGRFSMVRNGEPIRFSAKTRKPIELMKTLLASGGREVNTAQLTDILWPDAEGDAAHNVLSVTLHRLRTLLGVHEAILVLDNKLELNPAICWVDTWEYERLLCKLDFLLKAKQPCPQTLKSLTAKLLELCKGAYLKGDMGAQVNMARERLQGKLLRAIDSIGQYWEQNGDWSNAMEYYLKGLEMNPMIESLYQRLMICHREMGQRSEALIVYNRCHKALSEHLNILPCRHTDSIRRTLIAD